MGMAAAAAVLFADFLKFDPQHPDWPDRDRFVLSAGHGSMLLYSLLHLCGYPQTTLEQIKNFRQWGSNTPGHPEYGIAPGVETTTGPLGQGFANAVGMALAERMENAQFGGRVGESSHLCRRRRRLSLRGDFARGGVFGRAFAAVQTCRFV